jgi:hypothetical protein
MVTRWSLAIDCAHPGRLAAFWAVALGYVEKPPPAGFESVVVAVERLTSAGATVIKEYELLGRPDHVVMADPEGNEFCVF